MKVNEMKQIPDMKAIKLTEMIKQMRSSKFFTPKKISKEPSIMLKEKEKPVTISQFEDLIVPVISRSKVRKEREKEINRILGNEKKLDPVQIILSMKKKQSYGKKLKRKKIRSQKITRGPLKGLVVPKMETFNRLMKECKIDLKEDKKHQHLEKKIQSVKKRLKSRFSFVNRFTNNKVGHVD